MNENYELIYTLNNQNLCWSVVPIPNTIPDEHAVAMLIPSLCMQVHSGLKRECLEIILRAAEWANINFFWKAEP